MRSANVPESPSSALHVTYFRSAGDRLPLDARGKRRAAPPAEARVGHFLDDVGRAQREGPHQALVAAVRQVVVEADGIRHAHARERQPFLLREVRNRLDQADAQRVRAALEKVGVEERPDVGGGHRSVTGAAVAQRDLDERLEPDHAARAVADDRDVHLSNAGFFSDRLRDLFRAQRQRGGVTGNENRRRH